MPALVLRDARAMCTDGKWCVVDTQLEQDVMTTILSLCIEHDWPLNAVPTAECVSLCLAQLHLLLSCLG